MVTDANFEKEIFPGYEWELDSCCARCGSTHYLIFDEESEEIYCGPCVDFIRHHKLQSHAVNDIDDVDDFVL